MSITLNTLLNYLNDLLKPEAWQDYCPNGLQVEGGRPIHKLITGVSACQSLLDEAVEANADAILVHHGYFWKGENPCVIGIKRKRLLTLLTHDIALLAYHLPLDAHVKFGNNVQLARKLNIEIIGEFTVPQVQSGLGLIGELPKSMTGHELTAHIEHCLQRKPLHIAGQSQAIKRMAWCTGAAEDFIEQAILAKVDAYLTGEVSERTVHIARESGIHFYAAGHHATERYGVKALGEHLADHFNIQHQFIDIDNPV